MSRWPLNCQKWSQMIKSIRLTQIDEPIEAYRSEMKIIWLYDLFIVCCNIEARSTDDPHVNDYQISGPTIP